MFDLAFKIFILSSVLAYAPGLPMPVFDSMFIRIWAIVFFALSQACIQYRGIPDGMAFITSLLLGVGLISSALNKFSVNTLAPLTSLFYCLVIIFSAIQCLKNTRNIYKYILIGALINIAMYIAQINGFNPIMKYNVESGQEGAMFGNLPRLSIYLSVCYVFARRIHLILAGIFIAFAAYTKQYSILAVAIVMEILRIKGTSKRILAGMIGIILCAYLKDHILASLAFRWHQSWLPSLQALNLLGYGLGTMPQGIDTSANSLLQFALGTGILGVFWLGLVALTQRKYLTIPIVGLLTTSMIEYPFEIVRLWPIICFIFVFSVIHTIEKEEVCISKEEQAGK